MSGQVKISNSNKISLPGVGKVNSYELKADIPCFFIKNHYLYPLEKSYNMKLTNPVSVNQGNELSLKLKLPKQIFSEDYIYELKDFDKVKNLSGGIQIVSSDGCINKKLNDGKEIEIQDLCGWIVIKITYTTPKICNICEINYSICFDHFKLKIIKGKNTRAFNIIPLEGVSLTFDIFNKEACRGGDYIWHRLIDGNSSDKGNGIAVGPDGCVYVTGYADGDDIKYDNTSETFDINGQGAFVIKYDSDGKYIWHQVIIGSDDKGSDNKGNGISVDANGCVYVIGNATGSDIRYNINDTSQNFDVDGEGAFVIKYNSDGKPLWVQLIDGDGVSGNGIAVYSDSVYVIGNANPNGKNTQYDIDDTSKTFDHPIGSIDNFTFIIKYNAIDGNPDKYQLINNGEGKGISVDSNGVYITDYARKDGIFYDIYDTNKIVVLTVNSAFVIKYDLNLSSQWYQIIYNNSNNNQGHAIAVGDNGVYVTGVADGNSIVYDKDDTSQTFDVNGKSAFVIKYDLDGKALWYQTIDGIDADGGNGIAVGPDGVYVTGFAHGNIEYDKDDTSQTFNVSGNGAFVVKYDFEGKSVWYQTIDGYDGDKGNGIAVGSDGVYVTGSAYHQNIKYDKDDTSQTFNVENNGVFVIKYCL